MAVNSRKLAVSMSRLALMPLMVVVVGLLLDLFVSGGNVQGHGIQPFGFAVDEDAVMTDAGAEMVYRDIVMGEVHVNRDGSVAVGADFRVENHGGPLSTTTNVIVDNIRVEQQPHSGVFKVVDGVDYCGHGHKWIPYANNAGQFYVTELSKRRTLQPNGIVVDHLSTCCAKWWGDGDGKDFRIISAGRGTINHDFGKSFSIITDTAASAASDPQGFGASVDGGGQIDYSVVDGFTTQSPTRGVRVADGTRKFGASVVGGGKVSYTPKVGFSLETIGAGRIADGSLKFGASVAGIGKITCGANIIQLELSPNNASQRGGASVVAWELNFGASVEGEGGIKYETSTSGGKLILKTNSHAEVAYGGQPNGSNYVQLSLKTVGGVSWPSLGSIEHKPATGYFIQLPGAGLVKIRTGHQNAADACFHFTGAGSMTIDSNGENRLVEGPGLFIGCDMW